MVSLYNLHPVWKLMDAMRDCVRGWPCTGNKPVPADSLFLGYNESLAILNPADPVWYVSADTTNLIWTKEKLSGQSTKNKGEEVSRKKSFKDELGRTLRWIQKRSALFPILLTVCGIGYMVNMG